MLELFDEHRRIFPPGDIANDSVLLARYIVRRAGGRTLLFVFDRDPRVHPSAPLKQIWIGRPPGEPKIFVERYEAIPGFGAPEGPY